ncbi:hypothetical protein ACFW2Y_11795 [Streptomyces sp. NPDC058877]|uniref:hypothetical protein n=1 Tax=unclassified Streptomyces TaxID=2593676 RepID=UPI0036932C65
MKSPVRIHRIPPTVVRSDRRGAGADRTHLPEREAARLPVTAIDAPALPEVLAELAAPRADGMGADTVRRMCRPSSAAGGRGSWWWHPMRSTACASTSLRVAGRAAAVAA